MIKLIFKYEWKNFYRNRLQVIFYGLLFLAGIYAISYGHREIAKQNNTIALIGENEKAQISDIVQAFQTDTTAKEGKATYMRAALPSLGRLFHKYNTVFQPTPYTAFSLGQRDLFPYYHKLNSHSLYMQVFKNEIVNPQKLLSGNLDLAFVFIYLLPLFIIAMGYGLVSGEKENGSYPLLGTGAVSLYRLFAYKMLFRFVLAAAPVFLLTLLAVAVNRASLNGLFVSWLTVSLLYVALWCAVVFLVASFNKSSAFNTVALLGIWLFFLIVVPAFINAVSVSKYPINQTVISDAIRRMQLDESEHGQKEVFDKYYTLHPEYKPFHIQSPYNMAKIYAMGGEMKDEENRTMIEEYFNGIKSRDYLVSSFNAISPAANAQQLLNYISGSDIRYYLDYHEQLKAFHKELALFYNSTLYQNKTLTAKGYENRPKFEMRIKTRWSNIYTGMLILGGWTVILPGFAFWKMKRM
ncbi:MAG: ABC transporter permease subunit [Chitinophagaceae bacterium]|nr:ABC transporter permease subunit [Chitinophagaceae bacterium]